jgi:hypothetical protein
MAVTAWTKHLKTEVEKSQYVESLHRVKWILDHIKELIKSSADSLESSEVSPASYDNVNWAYRQAHSNGYKQALRDFTKLLTLDQEENNGRQPIIGGPLRTRSTGKQVERQDTTGST